jgi:hypothetical protein
MNSSFAQSFQKRKVLDELNRSNKKLKELQTEIIQVHEKCQELQSLCDIYKVVSVSDNSFEDALNAVNSATKGVQVGDHVWWRNGFRFIWKPVLEYQPPDTEKNNDSDDDDSDFGYESDTDDSGYIRVQGKTGKPFSILSGFDLIDLKCIIFLPSVLTINGNLVQGQELVELYQSLDDALLTSRVRQNHLMKEMVTNVLTGLLIPSDVVRYVLDGYLDHVEASFSFVRDPPPTTP